jgi:hypothetical protein
LVFINADDQSMAIAIRGFIKWLSAHSDPFDVAILPAAAPVRERRRSVSFSNHFIGGPLDRLCTAPEHALATFVEEKLYGVYGCG